MVVLQSKPTVSRPPQLHYEAHLAEWRAGPMGLASAQQAFLRTRRDPATGKINPNDPLVPPLPDGWVEELDSATGVYFYINDAEGERTWVRPNFQPPSGPMMGGKCSWKRDCYRGRITRAERGGYYREYFHFVSDQAFATYPGPPPNFRGPPPHMGGPPPNFRQPPPNFSRP